MQDDAATQEILAGVGEPGRWAMFLDIDGTLLNLALTPGAIEVPPALPGQLHRLSDKLGGAALVTGSLAYADGLFKPFAFHAGLRREIRSADGVQTARPPRIQALKHMLTAEASVPAC